ncbi:hypothetical protein FRC14_005550 [Serendipita sp. 396]|nr:hypothetical protein FRC14_005550 [Serendipita sp. 396]KAG8804491.1 hypothetical protein FRC16_007900 [Serendipita sp. 398]
MDATIAGSIEDLAKEMLQLRVTQYTATVGTVVYFYDYFLTLGDEITLFWKTTKKIALVRILYIVTRYVPAIGLVCTMIGTVPASSPSITRLTADCSPCNRPARSSGMAPFLTKMTIEMCVVVAGIQTDGLTFMVRCRLTIYGAAICTIATTSATAIFCVRMYTLYQSSPIMRICLVGSFWTSVVLQLAFASTAFVMLNPILRVVNKECAAPSPNSDMMQYFMASSVLAPLICEIMIMYAMVKHAIDRSAYLDPKDGSPLLRRLYADGSLYFALVFTLRVSSCLVWYLTPIHLKPMFDYLNFALTSTFTCRFALALRLAANPPLPTYVEATVDFTAAAGTGGNGGRIADANGAGSGGPSGSKKSGRGSKDRLSSARTSALWKSSHGPKTSMVATPTDPFWVSCGDDGDDAIAVVDEEEEMGGDGTATPSPSPSSAQALNRFHVYDHRRVFGEALRADDEDDKDGGDGTSNEDFELAKLPSIDRIGISDTYPDR